MRLALVGGAVAVGAIAARALVRRMTGQASNSAKLRLRLRGGGGDTEMLKKASLVCPWGGWLALKLSKSRPPTAPVSTPFKVSMTILAVYFGAVALASEFLPNFILGETVEPIEDNTTCATSPDPSSRILAHTTAASRPGRGVVLSRRDQFHRDDRGARVPRCPAADGADDCGRGGHVHADV